MIALALLATAPADTTQLQRQLDFIVSMCRADKIVRFVAHAGNDVTMERVKPGQLPSVSENKALACALDKVKARTDLQLRAAKQGGKP